MRGKLFKPQAGFAAQFPHGALQHHAEMLADHGGVGVGQIQHGFNPHGIQPFTQPPPNAPYLLDGQRRHQLTLPLDAGEIEHAAGLPLPFFGREIRQLGEGFGGGNTHPDGQVRTLQQRLSNFTAKGLQIEAIADAGEIAKGLINVKER